MKMAKKLVVTKNKSNGEALMAKLCPRGKAAKKRKKTV